MFKNIFFSLLFLFKLFNYFAQSIPEYDQFEVYKQDKNNKILIIPFENKMYSSAIDNEIAEYNRLSYSSIKEEMKKGISEQILLSISNKTPAISLEHHKDSNSQILNYIYNSIGLKYEKLKTKDTVEVATKQTDLIKKEEGKKLLSKIKKEDLVILLDEKGKSFNSLAFAKKIETHQNNGVRNLVFIIGGAFGFSDQIYTSFPNRMRLSDMTFSHQMIRLFFCEQLYRAYSIIHKHPYHNS